jgi:hypothetical protein
MQEIAKEFAKTQAAHMANHQAAITKAPSPRKKQPSQTVTSETFKAHVSPRKSSQPKQHSSEVFPLRTPNEDLLSVADSNTQSRPSMTLIPPKRASIYGKKSTSEIKSVRVIAESQSSRSKAA